jgi:hypothetical protein
MSYQKYFKGGMCGGEYAGGCGEDYAGGCGESYSGGVTVKNRLKKGVSMVRSASRKKHVRLLTIAIIAPILMYIAILIIKPKMFLVADGTDKVDQKKVLNTVLMYTLTLWVILVVIHFLL